MKFVNDNVVNAALNSMLANTNDMIFIKDINSVYLGASISFAHTAGHETVEELVGKTDYEIFKDQELAERYYSDDRKLFSGGKDLIGYVEPLNSLDGKSHYCQTSKYIIRSQSGEALGMY